MVSDMTEMAKRGVYQLQKKLRKKLCAQPFHFQKEECRKMSLILAAAHPS